MSENGSTTGLQLPSLHVVQEIDEDNGGGRKRLRLRPTIDLKLPDHPMTLMVRRSHLKGYKGNVGMCVKAQGEGSFWETAVYIGMELD